MSVGRWLDRKTILVQICSRQASQTKVGLIHVWQAYQNIAATHSAELIEQRVETIDMFQHIRTDDQVKLSILEGKICFKINNCIWPTPKIDTKVLAIQGIVSKNRFVTSYIENSSPKDVPKVIERPLLPSGPCISVRTLIAGV